MDAISTFFMINFHVKREKQAVLTIEAHWNRNTVAKKWRSLAQQVRGFNATVNNVPVEVLTNAMSYLNRNDLWEMRKVNSSF